MQRPVKGRGEINYFQETWILMKLKLFVLLWNIPQRSTLTHVTSEVPLLSLIPFVYLLKHRFYNVLLFTNWIQNLKISQELKILIKNNWSGIHFQVNYQFKMTFPQMSNAKVIAGQIKDSIVVMFHRTIVSKSARREETFVSSSRRGKNHWDGILDFADSRFRCFNGSQSR